MSPSEQSSREQVESESSLVGTESAAVESTSSNKNDRPSVIQAKDHGSPNSPARSTEAERENSLDADIGERVQVRFHSYHIIVYRMNLEFRAID